MSAQLRKCIAKKIIEAADKTNLNPAQIQNSISSRLSLRLSKENHITLNLKVRELPTAIGVTPSTLDAFTEKLRSNHAIDTNGIVSVNQNKNNLEFALDPNHFVKNTLENVLDPSSYKIIDVPKENILVEYSSPNIAKPFHMGHLRSTIIGNTMANILAEYGHNVTRINYLGDWGTQFGFLKLGMDMKKYTADDLAKNPIRCLYEAYVHANKLGETDESISKQARDIFNQMENDDSVNIDSWNSYRKFTVQELERVYSRLNIKFDEYAWESDYRKARILPLLERIKQSDCIEADADGLLSYIQDDGEKYPILKSDGSTLYITRDIAAIMERQEKYKFDRMYYVVGAEQIKHFETLFAIAKKLGIRNAERLHHIRFGRLLHMSTRKGNAIFLDDILNEMRDIHYEKQLKSEYTKIDLEADGKRTADMLGVSAIIAYELRSKAKSSYAFDMDEVLKYATDVGGSLQLAHCRLCSLKRENSDIDAAEECDPSLLLEPSAVRLAFAIAQFPEVLCSAYQSLNNNEIYFYALELSKRMRTAMKPLKVKYEPDANRQAQRMLLFESTRKVLAHCLRLINLTPLEKV